MPGNPANRYLSRLETSGFAAVNDDFQYVQAKRSLHWMSGVWGSPVIWVIHSGTSSSSSELHPVLAAQSEVTYGRVAAMADNRTIWGVRPVLLTGY